MKTTFEEYWETDPINCAPIVESIKLASKNAAKRAWEAATEQIQQIPKTCINCKHLSFSCSVTIDTDDASWEENMCPAYNK